jgi:SpoVK/Ycf46/Vps4 family AAA+-type ATPase
MLVPQRSLNTSSTGSGQRIVTSFLTEMDGIFQKQSNDIIFLIAVASDRSIIDPAILRPGRIDIHIQIDLPNLTSRISFLKQSLQMIPNNIPSNDDIIMDLAMKTVGYSCADLSAILKKASIIAIRKKDLQLGLHHILEAFTEQ